MRRPLVRAVAGVLVVAIAGFVLARSGGHGSGARSGSSGSSTTVVQTTSADAGARAAYALGLNAVITRLNAVRSADGSQVSQGAVQARVTAAEALSVAHRQAATSAQALTAGSAATANATLVAALRQTGAGYAALASAESARRTAAYRAAQTQLQTASAALTAAYARLRALGYRIG